MIVHVKDNVAGAIYIGRWNSYYNLSRSPFFNPFKVDRDGTREQVIAKYRAYLTEGEGKHLLASLPRLRNRPLACWCRHHGETEPGCHGDVLLDLLERYTDEELRTL